MIACMIACMNSVTIITNIDPHHTGCMLYLLRYLRSERIIAVLTLEFVAISQEITSYTLHINVTDIDIDIDS